MDTLASLRSMLYAPGDEERKMRKALESRADAVIFDLEDAVAPQAKSVARATIAKLLDELAASDVAHPPVFVRMSAPAANLATADLEAAVRPALTGLKLPKTESANGLAAVDAACEELERERGMPAGSTVAIPGIESARGLEAITDIARAPRVWCLSFGAVDFARDLGTEPSADGVESLVALSTISIASAAARLRRPIDSAWSAIADEDGLRSAAHLARRLGFQGKAVIHPRQVRIVNEVFSVTEAEADRARSIIAAAHQATGSGRGAIQVGGSLVDAAHVRRARATLEAYERQREELAGA